MGTNNFYNRNASKVFAVLMNKEQFVLDENGEETEETEEVPVEDYDIEFFDEYLQEKLSESKFETWIPTKTTWEEDSNRNFEGRILGELSIVKNYGDVEIKVEIQAICRAGYYEGANLDWELKYYIDGNNVDMEYIEEEFIYQSGMNAGLKAIQSKKAYKWLETQGELITEEMERIFTEVSMPLIKVAQFSNGEAIYEKA